MLKILILLWTLTCIVLNLCEIGKFASWEITAWPWSWSCLCIFYWWIFFKFIFAFIVTVIKVKKQKEWDNAPEWYKHFNKRPE